MSSVFDTWRKEYPELSYSQHQEYARWLYENYPNQSYFGSVFQEQVIDVCKMEKPIRVMELGGWNGELASAVLKENTKIMFWDNFEICSIVPSVCADDRYIHCDVNDFIWNLTRHFFNYDLFVSSHALEHLNADDFEKLLNTVSHIPYLALQLPFPKKRTWDGESCFHILELSAIEFVDVVKSFGYKLEHTKVAPEEHRFFFRKVAN